MASPLRQFTPSLFRSAAALAPCHSVLINPRRNELNKLHIKQFSRNQGVKLQKQNVNGEVLHGSREWRAVRFALPEEGAFHKFRKCNARIGVGKFVFNSRTAITEEVWRESLRHATKKLDVLRLCFGDKGEDVWLYEVKNHDIDLKVVESKQVMEVAEDLKNEAFDKPFWCVRIVPADDEEVHPIPEIEKELPYQYNFIMRIDHGTTDGGTLSHLIRIYTEILDDILSGKPVDDDIKFGQFIYDDPLQTLTQDEQKALESDPLRLEEERTRISKATIKPPLIYSAFPKPEEDNPTTRHIVKKLDNSYMNNFIRYCKLKKINITPGFEAVFNIALVEMVQDKGIVNDGYEINIRQTINMRRYLHLQDDKDLKNFPVGLLTGGMQQGTYSKNVTRSHFWEHAKEIHDGLHSLLDNNVPIIENIMRPQVLGHLDPEALAMGPPRDNSDYAFSNVLDLTPFVFYEGTQVQLTEVITLNFQGNILYPILFQFSTYRGVGQLTGSYYTAKIADDTAHELMDRIVNVLDFVAK